MKRLVLVAAVCVAALLWVDTSIGQTFEDCIGATARIRADDGSTGTGTFYGQGEYQGNRVALFATAAHVVTTPLVTVQVGRDQYKTRGVVVWRRADIDGASVGVRVEWFQGRRLVPVPLVRPGVRIQVGQPVFSIGHPGGGPALLWRGTCTGYHQDGSMLFRPGPELGRSGSAIFTFEGDDDEARIVGIISARDSQALTRNTTGRAVSVDLLQSREWKSTSAETWFPVRFGGPGQCGPNGCPSPGVAAPGQQKSPYHSPYRRKTDGRISMLEKSEGTSPLPPPPLQYVPPVQPPCPPVDLKPLESELSSHAAKIAELERRADKVRDTAEMLAKKYEDQLPGITDDVDKAIAESQAAAILAAKAQAKSDEAKTEAEGAKTEAKTVTTKLAEAVDEDNPKGIVGKLKARIDKAKEEGAEGAREVAKTVAMGILQTYGLPAGIALAILGFVVWDVRQKVTTGDKLAVEKGVIRVRKIVRRIKNRGKANEEVIEEEVEE